MASVGISLFIVVAIVLGIFALIGYLTSWVTSMFIAFILVCAVMMLVVLIQKPKGGGLSGAFGGAGGGSSQAVFGSKVGDVLTWVTVGCFVLFLLLAGTLTIQINAQVRQAPQPTTQTPAADTTPQEVEDQTEADQPLVIPPTQEPVLPAEGQTQDAAEEQVEQSADEQ